MVRSFNRFQEVELDELHLIWEIYYKALYSFGMFIDHMKILLNIRVM